MLLTPGGRPYSTPITTGPSHTNHGAFMSRRPADEDAAPRSYGSFRTVCVRACDGYYFPLSNSTTKSNLYRDNMKCRSQCGDDARMFYLPSNSTDIDGALDLQGRSYGRTATAYVYRKTLVAGCQCKPDPWSETELERHKQYAEAEGKSPGDAASSDARPTTVASASDTLPAGEVSEPKSAEVVVPKQKPAPWKTTVSRATPKPIPQPSRLPTQQASAPGTGMFGGGMGLGGSQMTWPGDAPPRRP